MSETIDLKTTSRNTGTVDVIEFSKRPIILPDGSIAGEIENREVIQNTFLYTGRQIVRELMDGTATEFDPIAKFAIGDGAYLPGAINPLVDPPKAQADYDGLKNELFSKTFSKKTNPSQIAALFITVLEPQEFEGNWNEIMLKTANDVPFSMLTTRNKVKSPGTFLVFRWVVVF